MPNDFFEKPIGTVSVFNGPQPEILVLDTPGDEIDSVAQWLSGLMNENIKPHEIGVFVRSLAEVGRVRLRAADKDAWDSEEGEPRQEQCVERLSNMDLKPTLLE